MSSCIVSIILVSSSLDDYPRLASIPGKTSSSLLCDFSCAHGNLGMVSGDILRCMKNLLQANEHSEISSVGQSRVLIVARLWLWSLYGPFTSGLELVIFVSPFQIRISVTSGICFSQGQLGFFERGEFYRWTNRST